MSQRRDSVELTRLKDVASGDKTGLYYITLCNLPFGTSWQELKDYTRMACDVDHVEVFRTSTSGWVRVMGRANFDKAWRLLNGGLFNGRSIIASDKNATEAIKIKELVDGIPEPAKLAQPPIAPPGYSISPPRPTKCRQQEHSYISTYPQARFTSYGDRPVMISDFRMPGSIISAAGEPGGHDSMSYAAYSAQTYGSFASPWDRDAQYGGAFSEPSDAFKEAATRSSANAYIPTERRQIVVTGFPRKARSDDVASWIRRRMGHQSAQISHIDGPAEHSKTAYVTFKSSVDARPGVEALDSLRFQAHTIKAKIAKEGTPSPNLDPKITRKSEKSSRSRRLKPETHCPASGTTKTSSSGKAKPSGSDKVPSSKSKVDRSRSVGGILIVDGSSAPTSAADKETLQVTTLKARPAERGNH